VSASEPGPAIQVVGDWAEFTGLVRAAFFTVKRAIALQRPGICRHVMTEEAWQGIRAQVDVLRLDGCFNLQSGIDITQVTPGAQEVAGGTQRATVRLLVSGVECVVSAATGRLVSGRRERGDHLEEWTFERSRDPEAIEQERARDCPKCGAPLTVDDDGQCAFCHAVVPGAKTDWLVATIAHPSESSLDPRQEVRATVEAAMVVNQAMAGSAPSRPPVSVTLHVADAAAPGVAAIQKHDAAFNAQDLVVEAREVFFKLEEARNQLRPAEIRALVGDDLYAAEVQRAAQVRAAGRNEVRAYLEINDLTFIQAGCSGGRDRLVARVSAVSARSLVDLHGGDLVEADPTVRPWAEDMIFERSSTAGTNALTGLLAHRCPACGEPAQVAEDGRCVFCARHVTGGELDWILLQVLPVEVPAQPG
jgi:predicted lipid-binding transport protein (Tim44 family)